MNDGTIRVGTKLDLTGIKSDIKALEKELATVQKEADKLTAKEEKIKETFSAEREIDAEAGVHSHKDFIDEREAEALQKITAEREILNEKAKEYNTLLDAAKAKLQEQSAIERANKELTQAAKAEGLLSNIQTQEQYNSLLEKTRAKMEAIEIQAERIANKHGLSREQLLANNEEYRRLQETLEIISGRQDEFGKTAEKSFNKGKKSASNFGTVLNRTFKKLTRMGFAMLGVRSAFMAFRRAINSYTESNKELKNQMESLWNVAGQAIGPFVEALVKGISTAIVWINSLVKALSGIDIVARANAAALKKQANAAKASVAGFDEMNKLSDSSSETTGLFDSSMASVPQFLEKVKQQLLDGDWYGAGETIGVALMDGITGIDWDSLGDKVGMLLGGAVALAFGFAVSIDPETIFESANEFLTNLFTAITEEIEKIDWKEVGRAIADLLPFALSFFNPAALIVNLLLSPGGEDVAKSASEMIGTIVGGLGTAIVSMGQRIGELASSLWTTIKDYFDDYVDWESTPGDIIEGLWNGIVDALKNAGQWIYDNIWIPFRDGFKEAFDIHSPSKRMEEFGGLIIDGLCNGITGAINKVKQACTDIWNAIKEKFNNVGTWFKDTFSAAWQKVKDIFSSGGKIFDGIKDGIASTFKTIVNGLIGGINKVIAVPFNAINKMLNTIRGIEVLGVSPFKSLWSYNPLAVPQIPKLAVGGIVNRPGRGVPAIIGEAGAEAVLPLENNTEWMDILADKIGGNVTIPIYMDGKKIATYVVDIQKKKAFAMNGA